MCGWVRARADTFALLIPIKARSLPRGVRARGSVPSSPGPIARTSGVITDTELGKLWDRLRFVIKVCFKVVD